MKSPSDRPRVNSATVHQERDAHSVADAMDRFRNRAKQHRSDRTSPRRASDSRPRCRGRPSRRSRRDTRKVAGTRAPFRTADTRRSETLPNAMLVPPNVLAFSCEAARVIVQRSQNVVRLRLLQRPVSRQVRLESAAEEALQRLYKNPSKTFRAGKRNSATIFKSQRLTGVSNRCAPNILRISCCSECYPPIEES